MQVSRVGPRLRARRVVSRASAAAARVQSCQWPVLVRRGNDCVQLHTRARQTNLRCACALRLCSGRDTP